MRSGLPLDFFAVFDEVFGFGEEFEVLDGVVEHVAVFVMDDTPVRNGSLVCDPDEMCAEHPCVGLTDFDPGSTGTVSTPLADFHRAKRNVIDRTDTCFELTLRGEMQPLQVFVPWVMAGSKPRRGAGAFQRAICGSARHMRQRTVEGDVTSRAAQCLSRAPTGDGTKSRCALPVRFDLKQLLAAFASDGFHAIILQPRPIQVNGSGTNVVAQVSACDRYARFVGKPELAAHPETSHG